MDKLGELTLQNNVSVQLNYSLNQDILVKNFGIVMDCLKQLSKRQSDHDNKMNQFQKFKQSINNKINQLEKNQTNHNDKQIISKDNQKNESNHHKNDNVNNNNKDNGQLLKQINSMKEKISKNEKNILGNIQDINMIFTDINNIKNMLKNNTDNNKKDNLKQDKKQSVSNVQFDIDSIRNIHHQMNKNSQNINKLMIDLQKLKQQVNKHQQDIQQLKNRNSNEKSNNQNISNDKSNDDNNNNIYLNLKNNLNDLKAKLDKVANKLDEKIITINQHDNLLKDLNEENNKRIQEHNQNRDDIDMLKEQLKKIMEEMNNLQIISNQMKNIKNQVNKLKRKQQSNHNDKDKDNSNINASLDDNLNRNNMLYTQNNFGKNHDKQLKELRDRIQMLEKMISGSKHSLTQQRSNPEKQKLPSIKRPMRKEIFDKDKQKTGYSKKDINEIKNELQMWLKNYLDSNKDKDNNYNELELKLQQIRNIVHKKADQDGMRKGLTFLENKINHLYIFLTQPQTQDAMIIRKGVNCLSCSKKVEKLRNRLGPHVNWNNMTSTNYSPPRVGYSKPMGQNSIEKDDL